MDYFNCGEGIIDSVNINDYMRCSDNKRAYSTSRKSNKFVYNTKVTPQRSNSELIQMKK